MRIVVWILGASLYLFFYLGLIFHSSGGPVLGRYSLLYFLGLALMGLAALPVLFLLRFISKDTVLDEETGHKLTSWKKLRVVGMLILAIFLVAELTLQAQTYRKLRKQVSKLHPFLQIQGRANKRSTPTNSHGFRGEEIAREKPAGTFRLFFLGGSTVQCRSVDFEDSHVRLLEKRLRARYPQRSIEVQNLGHEWYTTRHSLENYLFRLKDFRPDAIVIYHGINDLCRSFAPRRFAFGSPRADYAHFWGPMAGPALGPFHRSPIPYPYVFGWLGQEGLYSDFLGARAEEVKNFMSLLPFERNLRSLANTFRSDGVRLIFATQPYSYRADMSAEERKRVWMNSYLCENDGIYPDIPSMARGLALFNDVTRRVASESQIPLVDLAANIPKDPEHFRDGVHYTEPGNRAISGLIFDKIESAGWIDQD